MGMPIAVLEILDLSLLERLDVDDSEYVVENLAEHVQFLVSYDCKYRAGSGGALSGRT
jgi:hypothetical protein